MRKDGARRWRDGVWGLCEQSRARCGGGSDPDHAHTSWHKHCWALQLSMCGMNIGLWRQFGPESRLDGGVDADGHPATLTHKL